ncbi:toll/interleukin-1 receptor domain-containing protein [Streptomyces sp. HUAS 31]|uniref:toll/interleukin-1 receptor domain-containing protein n=1 Tax=Streptomyces sp. HUAS 31 TaxID=3020055 RepID=UPI0023052A64|nr:toll/interleukin-1 receptor domain-containing protein [Streptomyces sp. HUAS 31]WCD99475.1 toll/interleukin-1 receptor domain-containing protein [Streptomyces sp. HUAS 31]
MVFLSHTSRRRTAEELGPAGFKAQGIRKDYLTEILENLEELLHSAGFSVWWDRRDLRPGDSIDPTIYRALNGCQAAVVLIDADALDAGYMRREVNILTFRHVEHDLHVVPVLLQVDAEQVRDSALGRETGIDVQLALHASKKRNKRAARETAERIAQHLVAESAAWQLDIYSPENRWIDDVALCLEHASRKALRRAAETLDLDLVAWERSSEPGWEIAAALWSADRHVVYDVIEDVAYQLPAELRDRIVEHALPLWAHLRAARTVRSASVEVPGTGRAVSLATRFLWLGELLARRASAGNRKARVVRLIDVHGESTIQDLVGQSDATLRRELNFPVETPPEEVTAALRRRPGQLYAVLRSDTVNPATTVAVTRELQNRFPGIVMIVLNHAGSAAWMTSSITPAFDPFPREDERAARKFVGDMSELSGGKKIEVDSEE